MTARKEQINLLPRRGFEETTTGRVLTWILSTFRVIVIVTEIIVMIAFFSRFWLDAQSTDLSEEIKEKEAVLLASSEFEAEYRDVQRRLKIYSDTIKGEVKVSDLLNTVSSLLPSDLFLTSFSLAKNSLEIDGSSPNEKSIQQLIVNLSSTGKFEEVNLTELKNDIKSNNLLNFRISLSLKQK